MTGEEYIRQERAAGCRAHRNRGVWWQTTGTGVCKPLLLFQLIAPGTSRPARRHAYLAYSHLAPPDAPGTSRAMYWVIEEPQLRAYGMDALNHANRKAVAKARRSGLTVSRLDDLEPWWTDLREIASSMAERTGYGQPAAYYRTHFEEWKQSFRKEFAKPNREWWGVFSGNKLGAYMYAVQIDDTMHFLVTKVHSDFMPLRASDFLYFTLLEYSRDLPGCRRVNTGRGLQAAGVDRFKAGHGFQRMEVGEYFACNRALEMPLRWLLRFQRHFPSAPPEPNGRGGTPSFYRRALALAEQLDGGGAEAPEAEPKTEARRE